MPGPAAHGACVDPAREVGGDYYDFFALERDRLGLLIADVSGKGTSAALYMAELKGLMLSLTLIHRSPRELLVAANRIIADNLDSRSFITMTYAVLDLDARTMTYARAGHTPLIHLPRRGDRRRADPDAGRHGARPAHRPRREVRARAWKKSTLPLTGRRPVRALHRRHQRGDERMPRTCSASHALGTLIEEHGTLPFDELRERILREVRRLRRRARPSTTT